MNKVLVPFLFGMAAMGFIWSLAAVTARAPGGVSGDGQTRDGCAGHRFQIVEIPSVQATAWLLDACEGRVWRQHLYPEIEGNNQVWIFMPRLDGPEEFREWYEGQNRVGAGSP